MLLAEKEPELAVQQLSYGKAMEGITLELSPPSFLEGTVSDEAGHPVASAEVETLDPGGSPQARPTTDARGRYRLGPLPKGSHRVIVHADSYLDGFATKDLPEDGPALDFQLKKSVPVVGVAVDTEGQPLPHLALELWRPGARGTSYIMGHHRRPAMPVDSVKTDERGAFQLSAPASGPHDLNTDSTEVRFTSMTVVAPRAGGAPRRQPRPEPGGRAGGRGGPARSRCTDPLRGRGASLPLGQHSADGCSGTVPPACAHRGLVSHLCVVRGRQDPARGVYPRGAAPEPLHTAPAALRARPQLDGPGGGAGQAARGDLP